jgi:protein-tyrosine phosphatase
MIDLRRHILDGTPCGPDSFAESLEMCRAAIADGVKTIVATPRWEAGSSEPPLPFEDCLRRLERLEAEMRGALSLRLGFALQFSAELPSLVAVYGSRLALAGKRHLLVSLPSVEISAGVEEVWKSIALAGFSILLAHPECNAVLHRDPSRLKRWVSDGLMLQIDAASVLGTHGREVQRFGLECLRSYQGHAVVASNAHLRDKPQHSLAHVYRELSGKIGARQASGFTKETPCALIGDGVRRDNLRGIPSRSLASMLRSFGPIKALMGES